MLVCFINTTKTDDSMCKYRNGDSELIEINASCADSLSVLCLGCGLYNPGFNFQQRH